MTLVTLTPAMVDYADAVGCMRHGSAVIKRRARGNGPVGSFDFVLGKDRLGARCELAAKQYFNPVKWNSFSAKFYGEPDLGDFIDVKGRSETWQDLPVQEDGEATFAYLLVYPDPHPVYCLRGWMWGFDAKKPEFWGDKAKSGRPCFYIPQDSGLLRDPEELLAEVRRREAVVA
jgi:hypothetical protein